MDNNETTWLSSSESENDSLHWNNNTEIMNQMAIYVFAPSSITSVRVVSIILSVTGAVGFVGNSLIFFFLWKTKSRNPIQSSRFIKNLNLYVRSLSLSDLLSCAVSLPLLCIQMVFDVFQSGWPCKIVRYFNFIFPVITINSLVVISLEKYMSTRTVPRTFSFSTVRKMVICAWMFGLLFMLVPSAAFDGIRVDLNNTHFTVICRHDSNFYPFNTGFLLVPIQYVLPSIFIVYVNICLMKTVWNRRRQIGNGVSNAFKAHLRAKRIRGITLLVALTFAFLLPYFCFVANRMYTELARPQRDFATDHLIRFSGAGIAYFTSLFNFIVYFAQMKEFRVFLNKLICRKNNEINQSAVANGERRPYCLAFDRENVPGIAGNAIELRQFRTLNTM